MQLTPYVNFKSSTLSGGNKRKLSVSLALIGKIYPDFKNIHGQKKN